MRITITQLSSIYHFLSHTPFRHILTSALALTLTLSSTSQRLPDSRRSSEYSYIFRLSNQEARKLYFDKPEKFNDSYLHTVVDSFKNNSLMKQPGTPGHYLAGGVNGNNWNLSLMTVSPLRIQTVNNNRDLALALYDDKFQLVSDAGLRIRRRKIPFDKETQTYRINRFKGKGKLTIEYGGMTIWQDLNRIGPQRHPFFRRLAAKIMHPRRYIRRRNNADQGYAGKFSGFMVFNQPKYKPGDSVLIKVFLVDKKSGKPVNRPLRAILMDRSEEQFLKKEIQPYRPGGYSFSFVLHDSLDLSLDEYLDIALEEINNGFPPGEEPDRFNKPRQYAKWKMLMRRGFYYEDYELQSNSFSLRSEKAIHYPGEPMVLYLKGSDENDLALMDTRVNLALVSVSNEGNQQKNLIFIPDTLWKHSQALDPIGETKIVIPDSLFPDADLEYSIEAEFLNANNERHEKSLELKRYLTKNPIDYSFTGGRLALRYLAGKTDSVIKARVISFTDEYYTDTLRIQQIQLPDTIAVHPFARQFSVEAGGHRRSISPDPASLVECTAKRNNDSLFIRLYNPMQLPLWLTLFRGNKVIRRIHDTRAEWRIDLHAEKDQLYTVSMQHLWQGRIHSNNYGIPWMDKKLDITLKQPPFVYPGQEVPMEIEVTDVNGRPVADADVTAYAYTKKFEKEANVGRGDIPYLGKYARGPRRYYQFNVNPNQGRAFNLKLIWEKWSRQLGLDSIEYYRFLYPGGIYRNTFPTSDGSTQFAPFVVEKGTIVPIHILLVDERPVFFRNTNHLKTYSFKLDSGRHELKIRTANRLIVLKNFKPEHGLKNIISMEADTLNKQISIIPMPDTLTYAEKELMKAYTVFTANNFGENLAWLRNGDDLFLLNPGMDRNTQWLAAGPVSYTQTEFTLNRRFNLNFVNNPGYINAFGPQQLTQTSFPVSNLFRGRLSYYDNISPAFKARPLSSSDVDSIWQDYLDNRNYSRCDFKNPPVSDGGQLQIRMAPDKKGEQVFVKNLILLKPGDSSFMRAWSGNTRNLGLVPAGDYQLFLLLKRDKYFVVNQVKVLSGGINYLKIDSIQPREQNYFSVKMGQLLGRKEEPLQPAITTYKLMAPPENLQSIYSDEAMNDLAGGITGMVIDEKDGSPLPGVSIQFNRSSRGTSTDASGRFRLPVSSSGTILVSVIGYNLREYRVVPGGYYEIRLRQATSQLSEVVVVGYGIQRKARMVASSVSVIRGSELQLESALSGRVAGVTVYSWKGDVSADSVRVNIRGVSSLTDNKLSLIIVDGLPYNGRLEDLDPAALADMSIIKGEAAVAIYGADGANGVIIINSKEGKLNPAAMPETPAGEPASALRKNFRDYAYWQPALRTNTEGRVKFTARFPDDITNWKNFVIAITDKKQTGSSQSYIKSFKALSANITAPLFATEGDSIRVIGKVMNYGMDSFQLNRRFARNGVEKSSLDIGIRNSHLDSFWVVAQGLKEGMETDSLTLLYTIRRGNGYSDGEERKIPVFRTGTVETEGMFAALDKDSLLQIPVNPGKGPVTFRAEASLLPVLVSEIERVKRYEYYCNEQLASKLRVLLLEKRIRQFRDEKFEGEKNIKEIIEKLVKSRGSDNLWGWWPNNQTEVWISLHIMEALLQAQKAGYAVSLDRANLINYLIFRMESWNGRDKVLCLQLLHLLDAAADYKKYITQLEADKNMQIFDKLRLLELRTRLKLPVNADSLLARATSTMFGNLYWSRDSTAFFDNPVQNTILAYRILRSAERTDLLGKVRGYLLEQRQSGYWRNTYESALILETILPELLDSNKNLVPPSLNLSGAKTETVNRFPYEIKLTEGKELTVDKRGNIPVYITAYQQYWNRQPEKVNTSFTVHTWFRKTNGQAVTRLKGGEPVELVAEVNVSGDADYVMIEIPIPAGCSYKDKNQPWYGNEVHREYFKHKTSIFCSHLNKGKYTFTISLVPRYGGTYHLNPAKAELMYFPVFFGREGMKKVVVE